jgi:rhamnosyl/mannosyltransferase
MDHTGTERRRVGVFANESTSDAPDAHALNRAQVEETIRSLIEGARQDPAAARTLAQPWGSKTVLFDGPQTRVRRLEVRPGATLAPAMHPAHGIHWVVLEGRARMTIGRREMECGVDEAHYIPAGMTHCLQNPARTPLVVIEIDGGEDLLRTSSARPDGARGVAMGNGGAARSRPIRVVHVYKTFLPDSVGGLEIAIAQMAVSTRHMGIDTRIVSLSPGNPPPVSIYHGIEHYRYAETLSLASNSMSLPLLRDFGRHVDWADVIHYHFPWPFADLLHLLWRVRKPSIVTYHSDIVRQRKLMALYRPLMNRFLGRLDRIVATSPNYAKTSDVLSTYADKTTVVPIGLDPASYPATRPEALARWKAELGENFLLFIGVIRYYKGLHILLDALVGTPIPTVIVGSGPIEAELRRHAKRAKLRHVKFLGSVSEEDKAALLELSAAVVFPSHLRSEAFGVTLLEGAMFGKPLISSEIGTGTSYINIDGETGIVVPASDPEALRAAMLRLMGDPKLREEMGAAARRRFEDHFTADRMAARYAETYRELVDRQDTVRAAAKVLTDR